MKSRVFLVIGITLVVILAGLTGCSAERSASAADAQSININTNGQQGIAVNGEGKVTVDPDIATINLGVSARAPKVADAQSQAAAAMEKVMAVLTGNGIDKKDIQTQSYNIQQVNRYSYSSVPIPPDKGPVPVPPPTPTQNVTVYDYQVSNTLVVKIRAMDKTGSILDAVTAAGGDLIRVNSIYFSVDQPDKFYAQARSLAMNNAKSKANSLAGLAGVTLGKVTSISENFYSSPVPYPMVAYRDASSGVAGSTPINPGQTDIVLDIQVNYAIQ